MQQSKLGKIGKMNAQKEDIAENFIDSTNTLIFDDRQILLSFLIDNDIEYIKIFTRFTDKYIEDMKLGIFNRKEAIQIIKIDIVDEVNSQWIADSGIAFDKGFTELQKWNVAKHLVARFEANYANEIITNKNNCQFECLSCGFPPTAKLIADEGRYTAYCKTCENHEYYECLLVLKSRGAHNCEWS